MGCPFLFAMRYQLGPADRHAALAFQRLKFLPTLLKEQLAREGLWEDLVQEVYTAALEAWQEGMDDRKTFCHAARRLYQFLKAYGYCRNGRRDQNHTRREITYSEALPWDVGDWGLPEHPFGPHLFDGKTVDTLERVRALIQEHPEGIGKWKLFMRVRVPAPLFHQTLASLVEKGLVHEESRETPGRHGPPLTLVVPGPTPQDTQPDKKERIRRCFLEGKTISEIARELGCARTTVRRVTRDQPGCSGTPKTCRSTLAG